jgi:diguanylate cyclase (GGDEF)-like protein/PAS domain S-box-containing protein
MSEEQRESPTAGPPTFYGSPPSEPVTPIRPASDPTHADKPLFGGLPPLLHIAAVAGVAGIYFLGGKFGLKLAYLNPSVTAVWPPTGIALAALLLFGYRVWPGVMLGAFLVNLTTPVHVAITVGITVGNTLEALLGTYLVNRWARGPRAFNRAPDVFKFAFFAALLATTVSATIGVGTLCLGGSAARSDFASIWLTWWLGDAVGALVIAPFLILWFMNRRLQWNPSQFIEAATLLFCLFVVSEVGFSGLAPAALSQVPLGLFCVPILLWATFRFRPRECAIAVLLVSTIAIEGALHGFGPFARETPNRSLLAVQMFVGITSVMTLAISAMVTARKRAEDRFRMLVESAPSAMIMARREGDIVLVNSQAVKLFGYKREELIGQSIELLVPKRFRSAHPAFRAGFAAQPHARPMGAGRDLFALRKDGSEFPVEIGLNPIESEEGVLFLSAIVDLTERKFAETGMREANATLRTSVNELERQSREIAQLNQMSHLLQTCQSAEEAYTVIKQFTEELFPADSGAVFVLNTSSDYAEIVCDWGKSPPVEQVFSPRDCWSLRRGQIHSFPEGSTTLVCQHLSREQLPPNALCVPMMALGGALGVLHLRGGPKKSFHPGEEMARVLLAREQLAVNFTGHVALALANLRLAETLRAQSILDPLTGLHNRRHLKESLEREVRRAARGQRCLAVMMLDVDKFKEFNDTYGHDAADCLLRELGAFLQKRTRGEDFACRYGGDEFVIVLAETSVGAAQKRAQQLLDGIMRLNIPYGNRFLSPPTVSLGVALYPEHGATAEALMRAADVALYSAKNKGRDRIVLGQVSEGN